LHLGDSELRENRLGIASSAIDAEVLLRILDEPFVVEGFVDERVLGVGCEYKLERGYRRAMKYVRIGGWVASISASWSVEPGVGDREMRRTVLVRPRR
jgi:hypothetical protein